MFAKQSLSEFIRTLKLAGVLVSAAALFACGGGDPGPDEPPVGSSSSSSSSSSSGTSSSGGVRFEDADLAAGEQKFNQTCLACHRYEGNGSFTSAGEKPRFNLNDIMAKRGGFSGLASYIATYMPLTNPGSCPGECSVNTAGYMVSLTRQEDKPVACDSSEPLTYGMRTLRLLTQREYKNSLIDLGLASESDFSEDLLPPDSPLTKSSYPIHVHASVAVDEARNNMLVNAAEKLAPAAASRVRQTTGCGTNANNCANSFLSLAERIFRRPLTSAEQNTYRKFFTDYGAEEGMTLALTAAMTSPQFLYRSELGIPVAQAIQRNMDIGSINGQSKLRLADADAYVLDNYEFAALLAYTYTGSTPDQTLMQAARNNQLSTESQINQQIDRLLQTSRGREQVGEFGGNWMRADDVLRQSRSAFPEFTADIKKDMAREVRELFKHVFFNDLPYDQFLGGDFAVVNRRLAQFYGVNNFNGSDSDWKAISIPNRGGVITTGAFMAGNADDVASGPIKRAVDVRELMLCHHIGAPPTDLGSSLERDRLKQEALELEASGIMTSRMYFEAITKSEDCQVCHRTMINPLFGMEDFDQLGRYRTHMKGMGVNGVDGLPIDTAGQLIGLSDLYDFDNVIEFNGSKDLGQKISKLPAVRECLLVNTFRFTTGLPLDKENYSRQNGGQVDEPIKLSDDQQSNFACVKDQLRSTFESSNGSVRSVYRKIGTLDLLRLRKPIDRAYVN